MTKEDVTPAHSHKFKYYAHETSNENRVVELCQCGLLRYKPDSPSNPSTEQQVREILRGYEPTGHADGRPMGYDLAKDNRTEFGFYWEYDQIDQAAKEIASLIEQRERTRAIDELEALGWHHTEDAIRKAVMSRIETLKENN